MIDTHIHGARKVWIFVLSMLIILDCYFHIYVYYNVLQGPRGRRYYSVNTVWMPKNVTGYYEYPLWNGSRVPMDFARYTSSYYWFTTMKHQNLFRDLSASATTNYAWETPVCIVNTSSLDPDVFVNKFHRELTGIEIENSDVALGGYYAPPDCKPINKVAIIIPYRDRLNSLYILLDHLHPMLKKQELEYRIFVIEQYGTEKFNKGTLYNIAFLETQRFGTWDCLIFHDVDLVPRNEGISYSCPEQPTHISAANDSWGNSDPRRSNFGGVTALTPKQYETVNGYSNLYWDWGVEDDDFYDRLEASNYTIAKYNSSISRYAVLAHPYNYSDNRRTVLLTGSRLRFRREDLTRTKYNLVNVTQETLYTHILADVNPTNMPLDPKSLMQRLFYLTGSSFYGHLKFK